MVREGQPAAAAHLEGRRRGAAVDISAVPAAEAPLEVWQVAQAAGSLAAVVGAQPAAGLEGLGALGLWAGATVGLEPVDLGEPRAEGVCVKPAA